MTSFAERFPTAFVTGGSSGLGRVMVEGLLSEGVKVWAGSRSAARIEAMGLPVSPVALDLSEPEEVQSFLMNSPWEEAPVLLINNAGFGQFGRIGTVSDEDLSRQIQAMLESAIRLSRSFLLSPGERPSPAVVNVSSLAVEFPLPFLHGYNVVKAGLSGFSRSLALEFPGGGGKPFVIDLRPGDYRTAFNDSISGSCDEEGLTETWQALEHHLQAGANPAGIWPPLRRALLRGRSRTVRTGTFFQARMAPMMARFFPEAWVTAVQKRYYRMDDG